MCGIAGIVAPSLYQIEKIKSMAVNMSNSLFHRGPDASGVYVNSKHHFALSHRRLSIQDLSPAGHQPMVSSSQRFYIVFNGEIYNFIPLRNELKRLGHQFRGHSDTEVLLETFDEWGIEDALTRIRGMFAFVVWDSFEREFILARDRMGEKPLFFGWIDNCFVFASELKAINKLFNNSLEIHLPALASFFRFGYVPTPYSIYQNIFKLYPGTYLRIPISEISQFEEFSPVPGHSKRAPVSYWALDTTSKHGIAEPLENEREAIDGFDTLLRETILEQKIADVPIGAFLSGGIDSSLISAVMQAVSESPIKTFTIGFREKEFDEAPYAKLIADHIGSEHHEYYVTADDGLNLISDIPKHWDEPFADSSQIPSMLVAKIASRKISVCLTGDGGDELFCGYNRYFMSSRIWNKQQWIPTPLKEIAANTLELVNPRAWRFFFQLYNNFSPGNTKQSNFGLKIHKLAGQLRMKSPSGVYRYLLSYFNIPNIILPGVNEADSILDRYPAPKLGNFMNDVMFWDQLGYLVDDNLVKVDRSSMAYSLETRLPLLDKRIVEFSWRVPISMKYRNRKSKWLLRQVLQRYIPQRLTERPKMGFSVPISDWLKGPLKKWAGDLMHSEKLQTKLVVLDGKEIDRIWKEHQNGSHDHSHKIWTLCMLFYWTEHYYA